MAYRRGVITGFIFPDGDPVRFLGRILFCGLVCFRQRLAQHGKRVIQLADLILERFDVRLGVAGLGPALGLDFADPRIQICREIVLAFL